MTKNKKVPLKKVEKSKSKSDINNKIHNDLVAALSSYKVQLGEKKLESKIKKLTKLFVKGFKKDAVKEMPTATANKKNIQEKELVSQ